MTQAAAPFAPATPATPAQGEFPLKPFSGPSAVNPQDGADASRQTQQTQPEPLADDEREAEILRAGNEIEAAMGRYAASSDLIDRADADRARLRMEALIRGRSAAQVQRMEQERGIG